MMKAMMQGQGGDQFDMEEMQRECILPRYPCNSRLRDRHDATNGGGTRRIGWSWWTRRHAKHVGHAQDDGRYGSWKIAYMCTFNNPTVVQRIFKPVSSRFS